MNIKFQNALNLIPQTSPPIWFMRQAGRYQKSYQKLREKYSFSTICKTPELAASVALAPILEFDVDVAILFSDILFPLEAFGIQIEYKENGAPTFSLQLNENNFKPNFLQTYPLDLSFQIAALKATKAILPKDKSLIGFIGAPFTLFAYATEGHPLTPDLHSTILNLNFFKLFSRVIIPILKKSIRQQFQAGAEAVYIFDTAAGMLPQSLYSTLVVPELKELSSDIKGKLIYFTKGINILLAKDIFSGLALDSSLEITSILCKETNKKITIQGNFNERVLLEEDFLLECNTYFNHLKSLTISQRTGWVASLGHGILPKTDSKKIHLLVDLIRKKFA